MYICVNAPGFIVLVFWLVSVLILLAYPLRGIYDYKDYLFYNTQTATRYFSGFPVR